MYDTFKPYLIHAYDTTFGREHDITKVVVARGIDTAKQLFWREYPQYNEIVDVSQLDTDTIIESHYWEGAEIFTKKDMLDFAEYFFPYGRELIEDIFEKWRKNQ